MGIMEDIEKQEAIDSELERLEAVIDWSGDKDWFDDTFIHSLLERVQSGKNLTEKQLVAFENVEDMIDKHKEDEGSDYYDAEDEGCDGYDIFSGDIGKDEIPF